jgi:hypothetical protein
MVKTPEGIVKNILGDRRSKNKEPPFITHPLGTSETLEEYLQRRKKEKDEK